LAVVEVVFVTRLGSDEAFRGRFRLLTDRAQRTAG
jgi:hypothetical protein